MSSRTFYNLTKGITARPRSRRLREAGGYYIAINAGKDSGENPIFPAADDIWIREEYTDGGVTKVRARLNPELTGAYADGFLTAFGSNPSGGGGEGGGVNMLRVWQDLTNNASLTEYGSTTKIALEHIDSLGIWRELTNNNELASHDANTLIAASHIPDITTAKISNLHTWTGNNAITNVGTISSGVWHGTTIGAEYGGTGSTGFGGAYRVAYSLSATQLVTLPPNESSTRKYLSQVNGGVPAWSEISLTVPKATDSVIGGFQTGFTETGKNYAVRMDGNKAYVRVPWANDNTTYKLTLNGTTKGDSDWGTNLGSCYAPTAAGTSGNVLVSGGTGTAPSWATSLSLTTLTVSTGLTTLNGTSETRYALQVGSSTNNKGIQLYGELHFNGSDTAYINYTTANGIRSSEHFLVGTNTNPKSLTVYGTSSLVGALSVGGNIGSAGNITADGYLRTEGAVYIGGGSQYINYVASNSGLHTNVGFYSEKYLVGFKTMSASDARLKKNLRDVNLSVNAIAAAPAVTFEWRDKSKGRGAGSLAQYWQHLLPQNVHVFGDGEHLSMEYGNIALISAIILARKVKELEARVSELERRIAA